MTLTDNSRCDTHELESETLNDLKEVPIHVIVLPPFRKTASIGSTCIKGLAHYSNLISCIGFMQNEQNP